MQKKEMQRKETQRREMQRKRRRRRRRRTNIARFLVCAIPAVVIILAVVGISKAIAGKDHKKAEVASGNEIQVKNTSTFVQYVMNYIEETFPKTNPPSSTEDEKSSFTLADLDNPDGFNERPTENGIVLQNDQIDLNGLDTTGLDWGQGGDKDQWNRPAGCLQYQEKYGKYNAYFISDEPEKKVIYLTMDEGYEYGCSPRILDTLKEKNVHAVFFVTKSFAEQNPDLVKRMIEEGHEVGNHSVTHPSAGLPSQSIEQQTNEIVGNHNYIKEQFGYDMHLFRYPAGKFSEQSVALINNLNYKSVFWSFAYLDYDVNNQPDPAESLQKIMSCLHPGAIYLLHAESETNTQILGDFIDQARAQGYEFKLFQ